MDQLCNKEFKGCECFDGKVRKILIIIPLLRTFKDPVRTAQKTHSVSVIKANQLTLNRVVIAVRCEIHTKQTNTLCGQNVEFVNVKPCGTYSDHWHLKRVISKVKEPMSNTNKKKLNVSIFRAVNQFTVFISTTAQ